MEEIDNEHNQVFTCSFYPILTGSVLSLNNIQIGRNQQPASIQVSLKMTLRDLKNTILRPMLNALPLGTVPHGLKRSRMEVHLLRPGVDYVEFYDDLIAQRRNNLDGDRLDVDTIQLHSRDLPLHHTTRGYVHRDSIFVVECKQAEPGFLLDGVKLN